MTVTFNTQLNSINTDGPVVMTEEEIEKLYAKFYNEHNASKKPLKQYPVSHWWVTRVFHTTSEAQPIKWVPYDYACYGMIEDVESGFLEWIDYLGKNKDLTGFKVSTMCLDMLNGTSEVAKQFCKEHFQPKERVYINGPKKKPFPIKAAKHYQV